MFSSKNQKFLNDLENFEIKTEKETIRLDNRIYDIEEITKKITDITERFHLEFDNTKIKGTLYKANKALNVSLNNPSHRILNKVQYLKFKENTFFDLANLGLPNRTNYEIERTANNGLNLILHYKYHANLNYNGRCGGASNSGKIALAFDKKYTLKQITKAEFADCYQEIIVDDLEKITDKKTAYTIMNYSSSKKITFVVDLESATIKKEISSFT
ncbi:MAG: hypothetical protein HWD82_06515 [Flavobacteriaceae bacterium]|nr:hypothetical protein [Flavobacteriaceae bacterium]